MLVIIVSNDNKEKFLNFYVLFLLFSRVDKSNTNVWTKFNILDHFIVDTTRDVNGAGRVWV